MATVQNCAAIVMAAGESKRMKSTTTKVLHNIAGIPLLSHTLRSIRGVGTQRIVVVVGRQGDEVRRIFEADEIDFVDQDTPLGTGHAAYIGIKELEGFAGDVLVLCADVPLVRRETLKALLELHREKRSKITLITTHLKNPTGYGRVVRAENDIILRIVEEREATIEEKSIREINSGIMCFDADFLMEVLEILMRDSREGEYYLTDVIEIANSNGQDVHGYIIDDPTEVQGINDRYDLSLVEDVLRNRIRKYHMKKGVTIINPATVMIDDDIEIGEDTVINQGSMIEGNTHIGSRCWIGPFSRIVDSTLGENVKIEGWNYIKGVKLNDGSRIRAYESAGEEKK